MAMAAPTAAAASDNSRVLLLPVEQDETAVYSVQFAATNILRAGDAVVLLHVVPAYTDNFMPDMGFGGEPVMLPMRDVELEKSKRDAASQYMGTQLAPLLRQLVPGVSVQLVTPAFTTDARSVGQVVADVAKDMNAVMIILPSRGKGRVKELLLGSTSSYLTHNAACPVLVLRGC